MLAGIWEEKGGKAREWESLELRVCYMELCPRTHMCDKAGTWSISSVLSISLFVSVFVCLPVCLCVCGVLCLYSFTDLVALVNITTDNVM